MQNFEPQKMARAYVSVKISEYHPPPGFKAISLQPIKGKSVRVLVWKSVFQYCLYTWLKLKYLQVPNYAVLLWVYK